MKNINMQIFTQKPLKSGNPLQFRLGWVIVIVTGWILVSSVSLVLLWWTNKSAELRNMDIEALELSTNIESLLTRFRPLPQVLSQIPSVVNLLGQPSAQNIDQVNSVLKEMNVTLSTEKIFLLNSQGVVIASSNAQMADSVVGEDLSFRSYYKDALNGVRGDYHAVGTTNSRLGHYFPHPIYQEGRLQGVLVIKVNLQYAQGLVDMPGRQFLVSDANGVIFLADNPQWLFKLIPGVSNDTLLELSRSQQYGSIEFSSNLFLSKDAAFDEIICVQRSTGCKPFLHAYAVNLSNDWTIHLLRSLTKIRIKTFVYESVVGLSYWLLVFGILFYRSQQRYQQHLKGENHRLETRVGDLTQNLLEKNACLQKNVEQLKATNETLEQTRNELIVADRLALLGEVSVGLHHELNQPILAIKAYAENSTELLAQNNQAMAGDNLQQINEVADNMAAIVSQFKVFAKKEHISHASNLRQILDGALMIAGPKLKKSQVKLKLDLQEDLPKVKCNPILIQQVMVNLIINAQQATECLEQAVIGLRLGSEHGAVYFEVSDNGGGLAQNAQERVFTPFFTTKSTGLGLGLALSKKIIEINHGKIFVKSNSSEGTQFRFELPQTSQDIQE